MNDRVNQPYKIKGTMVQGEGYSYNLISKIDAEKLCTTLNDLTEYRNTSANIDTKLDEISKQVIQLKLSVNILGEEIEHLKEVLSK